MKFADWHAEQMKDPEFAAAYKKLTPAFEIARAIIAGRLNAGLSVEALAHKANLHPERVRMLEMAMGNPRLSIIQNIAEALGMELRITFEKVGEEAR